MTGVLPREEAMSCAHQSCSCSNASVNQDGKSYCSEACANDDRMNAQTCHCPHGDCQGHARV
jgi:hypothetical protein